MNIVELRHKLIEAGGSVTWKYRGLKVVLSFAGNSCLEKPYILINGREVCSSKGALLSKNYLINNLDHVLSGLECKQIEYLMHPISIYEPSIDEEIRFSPEVISKAHNFEIKFKKRFEEMKQQAKKDILRDTGAIIKSSQMWLDPNTISILPEFNEGKEISIEALRTQLVENNKKVTIERKNKSTVTTLTFDFGNLSIDPKDPLKLINSGSACINKEALDIFRDYLTEREWKELIYLTNSVGWYSELYDKSMAGNIGIIKGDAREKHIVSVINNMGKLSKESSNKPELIRLRLWLKSLGWTPSKDSEAKRFAAKMYEKFEKLEKYLKEPTGFERLLQEGTIQELHSELHHCVTTTGRGSASKAKKLREKLLELGWAPLPREKKRNARGKFKGTISKKAKIKRAEKREEHEAYIAKIKETKKSLRKLFAKDMAKEIVVYNIKQKPVKADVKIKTGMPEGKKAKMRRLRGEYAEWNKTHQEWLAKKIAEERDLRAKHGEMDMVEPDPMDLPRKEKKKATKTKKHKIGTTKPKVSNLPKGKPINYHAKAVERKGKVKPITRHSVESTSSTKLVCITTNGKIIHRVTREKAEIIIKGVLTSKGEAIWKYTTKSKWKEARAKGNAGFGFDPKPFIDKVTPKKQMKKFDKKSKPVDKEIIRDGKLKKKGKVSSKEVNFQ